MKNLSENTSWFLLKISRMLLLCKFEDIEKRGRLRLLKLIICIPDLRGFFNNLNVSIFVDRYIT